MPRSPTETIRFLTLDETTRLFRAIGGHRRDRFEFRPVFHEPRREPERPVHVRVVRQVTMIGRKRG